jgi:formylglycine-generating enzyme required for sulfatase activity
MWTLFNSKSTTHPGRGLASNAFGMYDMHGNVGEMCADYFDPDYYAAPPPVDDPGGPPDRGKGHAVRGGNFHQLPLFARSAARVSDSGAPSVLIGFRVVCEIPR